MNAIPEVGPCATIEEMCAQCDDVHAAIVAMIREMPDEYLFAAAYPEGWSAAKNIKHIARSTRLFSRWFGGPGWLIRLRGKAGDNPVSIENVRATNRPLNYDYGSYPTPRPINDGPQQKEKLIRILLDSAEVYKSSLRRRTEAELDQLNGLFGGFTLRTQAQFSIKHAAFHSGVVKARLKNVAAAV